MGRSNWLWISLTFPSGHCQQLNIFLNTTAIQDDSSIYSRTWGHQGMLRDYWASYRKANKTAYTLSSWVLLFIIEPPRRSAVIRAKLDFTTLLGWFFHLLPSLPVHKLSQVVVVLYYPFWIILGSTYWSAHVHLLPCIFATLKGRESF